MARYVGGPVIRTQSTTWKSSNESSHAQMHKNLETPSSQLLPDMTDYSLRWIVTMDIGTTNLYIRYKRPGSNEEISVDGYNAYDTYNGDGAIIPTDLYYPLDGGPPIWGRLIKMERYKGRYDERRLVRFWKPAIHQTNDDGWYHNDLKAQAMDIFGVLDVSRTENHFRIELVSVVLSKPSGWPQFEYLIFQDAAETWGLSGQISFVSETDGLALSWLRREAATWEGIQAGFSMIVVDWGGGTVDIDALEVSYFDKNAPKKMQVRPCGTKPLSLRHGSETSLELFAEHMHSRFSNEGYPKANIGPMVNSAVFSFSQMKSGFGLNQGSAPWFLEVRGARGGVVPLEQSEIKQQFEPSVKATTDAIDDIIETLKTSQAKVPQVIILGGGGSTFPYFQESLVERYERGGFLTYISVKRVQEFKKGVAEGSIHLRQDITGFMQYSLSRESYAIPCLIEDVPGADKDRMLSLYPKLKSKRNTKDGRLYFPIPVLQWFIKEGDVIGPNVVIRPSDHWEMYGKRRAKIIKKDDLRFEENLVIYSGHPGQDEWTPYNARSERDVKYRIERLIVDLRDLIDPKDLPRMNSKKGDSNRRVKRLDYDYSVEFEGETPSYFVEFTKAGEDTVTKLRVHTTKIDLARLEAHQSLSRNTNNLDVISADDNCSESLLDEDETILSSDTSSVQAATQLKREQEQRTAEMTLTAPSDNIGNLKMRAPAQLLDASEDDPSFSSLLQQNDSGCLPIATEHTERIISQRISSENSSTLAFCHQESSAAMASPRVLQHTTHHAQKHISEVGTVAVVPHKFDTNSTSVKGNLQSFVALVSLDGRSDALPGIPRKFQSQRLPQTKSRTSQSSRALDPKRMVTRQAVSKALTSVSPNVRRRKLVQFSEEKKENATGNFGDRPKGSLLPVPSRSRK